MTDNRNRPNQQNSSSSGNPDDNLEINDIVVEYDMTPEQAREVVRACGGNKRGYIDRYLRSHERSVSISRGQGDSGR